MADAASASLPDAETEEWRYSPIGELPIDGLTPVSSAGASTVDDGLADVVQARAATVTIVDGFLVDVDIDPGWSSKGLRIELEPAAALDLALTGSDNGGPTVFDHLHRAFSPGAVTITVPEGLAIDVPIVVLTHQATVDAAVFPHLRIEAGPGSIASVAERQTTVDGFGLGVPAVELITGAAANLQYVLLQENSDHHWQIGRQLSSVDAQATLTSGLAAFGGHYARSRTDSRLIGRGGTANLIAAYFGDGEQVHDFRTFQHHDARDTRSDLLFKGSQDDRSGSIYTGLIHIHPDGAGTNAFQTNRNVKLSDEAWAWSVPNLEIENNDVHCSHASTVSPVDVDQRFYLHARGVPPTVADRLIVAGFYDEAVQRLPIAGARDEVRRLIAEKLDHRTEPAVDASVEGVA